MDGKMTLQQYIQSRNYKKRILSKSKSKEKCPTAIKNPHIPKPNPLPIKGSENLKLTQNNPRLTSLTKVIKQIDETTQSFSLIHRKVEQIKEYVRQFIQNDKIFVNFCKKISDLQNSYRLELIQAYRYQLFQYQVENQGKMDENKKRILKQLNDNYMNSKFEYKKIILKQQNRPQSKKEKNQNSKNTNHIQRQSSSETVHSQSKLPIKSSVKTDNILESANPSLFSSAFYSNKNEKDCQKNADIQNNPQIIISDIKHKNNGKQPQSQKGLRYTRSPSSKKVIFLKSQPILQTTKQYQIPDFERKKSESTKNLHSTVKQDVESNIDIGQSLDSQVASNDSDNKNILRFFSKQSLQDKANQIKFHPPERLNKYISNQKSPSRNHIRNEAISKQREKLLHSKDYLRVNRT